MEFGGSAIARKAKSQRIFWKMDSIAWKLCKERSPKWCHQLSVGKTSLCDSFISTSLKRKRQFFIFVKWQSLGSISIQVSIILFVYYHFIKNYSREESVERHHCKIPTPSTHFSVETWESRQWIMVFSDCPPDGCGWFSMASLPGKGKKGRLEGLGRAATLSGIQAALTLNFGR